ncbi:MAG: ferredoxin:protochlorophyllide reductase (ATP-dependent) subunit N [Chloroflexi bacterium]|nr:ferredoxin:protochlorophyllide reductase (ATP-dependent) subunit N [Chloroflexota bacterium]
MTITPDAVTSASSEAIVLREDNGYHAFCGLTCVGWLYQKMKDSFFLILGTHTCAHLLQNALGVMIFAQPRYGVAMLEEADLSAPQVDITEIVRDIVEQHHPSVIFLLNSCTPEIMKVDFETMAKKLNGVFENTPVMPVRADGLEYTMTQAEDSVVQALLQFCPQAPAGEKKVVFLGAVNDVNTGEIQREVEKLGLPVGGFVPANTIKELPAIGPDTIIAPLQPYLAGAATLFSRKRGAKVLQSLFPIGPDGTRVFLEDLAAMFGKKVDLSEREAESWRNIEAKVAAIRGKRIFITGDNMLELPITRFLRKAGAEVLECGTPYVNRKFHASELKALGGQKIVEMPNMGRQIRDIRALQPDLVITNFWEANPFEAERIPTKWSTEIIFTPIYGFGGVGELANLFSRALNRRKKLDLLDWKDFLPSAGNN